MPKTKQSKNEGRTKDQYTIVLDQINSKINLLVEGHQSLVQTQQGTNRRLGKVEQRLESLDGRMGGQESEINSLKHGQRLTLDYLARIEAELHGEMNPVPQM